MIKQHPLQYFFKYSTCQCWNVPSIWNLATPDIDVYVDIKDYDIDVFLDIEYNNLDIDVTVFDIVVTKKKQIGVFFPESKRTGPPVGGRPHSPTRSRAGARGGARDDMTDSEDDETLQTARRVMA